MKNKLSTFELLFVVLVHLHRVSYHLNLRLTNNASEDAEVTIGTANSSDVVTIKSGGEKLISSKTMMYQSPGFCSIVVRLLSNKKIPPIHDEFTDIAIEYRRDTLESAFSIQNDGE